MYNPRAELVVLIDSKTKINWTEKRSAYEPIVSEIKVIDVPAEYSQKEASRYIKTSIHHYIDDDFLFIDCDTVITCELHCDFSGEVSVGAVLDTHAPLSEHYLRSIFQKEDKRLGFNSSFKSDVRYNGGLVYYRNNSAAYSLFEKWHLLWLESRNNGSSQDMPPLNQANYELQGIITELGGEWNCQISHNGLPYLHNAKIIHYYATSLVTIESPYILTSSKILKSIKATGIISDLIMEYLKNPQMAFKQHCRIIADDTAVDVVNSNLFSKLIWMRKKHPALFDRLNYLSMMIKNPEHKNIDK
jgi:lipopolysaccharide biosynthesis glycosyltransferase